jgi:predicted secreted protein
MSKSTFFALLLAFGTSAHAADVYNFKIIGFSNDNKIVAFADTAVQDGSGHGVAEVSIVDIAKNSVLAKADGRDEQDDVGSEKKALELALKKINLAKYGITAGKNTGETLLNRLPTDLSSGAIFAPQIYRGWSSTFPTRYELKLTTQSVGSIPSCYDLGEAKKMTLTLTSINATPAVNMVLQSDTRLPSSRGCVLGYRVSKVIRSGKALVVALDYMTPGFEGPDAQHMIVTTDKVDFAD